MMTRKDFEFIAHTINTMTDDKTRFTTANHFADYLADSNPRFDRERFLNACFLGVHSKVIE